MGDAETKRQDIRRQLKRYRLAEADMLQARAAAIALDREADDHHLMRALETAIVVCYARPFMQSNKLGGIQHKDWKPVDPLLRDYHRQLFELRSQIYAHTDDTDARDLVDVLGPGSPSPRFAEAWHPIDRAAIPGIVALCEQQNAAFSAKADALEALVDG